ncbi:MAG: hypothetical protein ACTSVM_01860 [Candidatus Ranarchaeia archaeon]
MSQIDERLIEKGGVISKLPALLVFGITIAIYAIGSYSLYNYLFIENPETTTLIGSWLSTAFLVIKDNFAVFAGMAALVFGVTVLGMILVLKLLSWLGKEVMIVTTLLPPLGFLAGGAYLYIQNYQPRELSYLALAIGAILLLIVFFIRKRISLAGDFIEFSARAVYAEPGTIAVSLFFSVFALSCFVMDYTASLWVWNNWVSTLDNFWLQAATMFGFFVLTAWILWSALYFSEGVIVAIVDDWYRNPEADRASVAKGVKKAWRVVGGIVWLGLIMAFFDTVGRAARSASAKAKQTKNPVIIFGALIFRFIAWLMKWLAQILTYFALPAMVIERYRFGAAVKRSYKLLTENLVDVLIANTWVGGVYAFFFGGLLLFYAGAGYSIGAYIIPTIISVSIDPFFISIGTAVSFFGFGFIPAILMLRPLLAAYKTIMYEYALDRESNFALPSRMSEKMRKNADSVISKPPTTKRWQQYDVDNIENQQEAITVEQPEYSES